MTRWLVCMLVAIGGCVASLPADDSLTADIACEAARMVVQLRNAPPPGPAPEPEKCCDACKGTGYITHGDGHRTPCPCPASCKCKARK